MEITLSKAKVVESPRSRGRITARLVVRARVSDAPLVIRRWRGIALGAATSLAVAYWLGFYQPTPVGLSASRLTEEWLRTVQRRARTGDWIVVRGTHIGDQVVAEGSAAELTHAAIYDAEQNEIVEAVGSGVTAGPIRELLAQSHRFLIVRPHDWTPESGQTALHRARGHVGFDYDFLGTIGLQSDRRFYCTELCVDAYRARERGWMPEGVIHPEHMPRFGEVIYDSGPRPPTDVAEIGTELRARFAQRLREARGVDYAAEVAPGIYRGGMPDAQGVEWLAGRDVRTVINLRHFHGRSEGRLVRAAGMHYEWIPLESTDAPEPEQVARFLAIVRNPEAHPIYVHCLHGVDRTGAMVAIYRMQEQGWNNAEALAEMEHFGAHGLLHDLRRFVGAFTPRR